MSGSERSQSVRRWACLCYALIFLASLGPQAQAIKRKPPVEANDHPEAVLITAAHSLTGAKGKCTGVLIGPTAVLTAAHTVHGFDTWEVSAPYAIGKPARVKVTAARVYPDSKRDPVANDLAVLHLEKAMELKSEFPSLHDGDLYPLDTKLVVIGRVANGIVSNGPLFKGLATLVAFPGNTNAYGGYPQLVEEGDSGGPVFVAGRERVVVGVVSGHLGFSRGNVRTDGFAPISRRTRAWIMQQVERSNKE